MTGMAAVAPRDPLGKMVLRTVLIVVATALTLWVIFLLRRPITWLVIAAFIAVAMGGPVNLLQRRMKRGFAIALAYLALIMIPIGLGAALIPSVVNQIEELAGDVPQYAQDVTDFVNENNTLNDLNDKFHFTSEIQSSANNLPSKIGDAAGVLQDIGVGVVNSVFAAVTILILSIFMVGGGPRWVEGFVRAQPPGQSERIERALRDVANAIGNYVAGALLQATIAAVLIAVVMIFVNFPVGVIVWIVWAIGYQQIENYVIQPQIQRRAVQIEPFLILIAVLFGSTLFGVLGAILAIPTAATIQIVWREYRDYRREMLAKPIDSGGTGLAPPQGEPPTPGLATP